MTVLEAGRKEKSGAVRGIIWPLSPLPAQPSPEQSGVVGKASTYTPRKAEDRTATYQRLLVTNLRHMQVLYLPPLSAAENTLTVKLSRLQSRDDTGEVKTKLQRIIPQY